MGSLNASKRTGKSHAVVAMQPKIICLMPKHTEIRFLALNEMKADFPNCIEGFSLATMGMVALHPC
jgi:hypothetical protein